MQRKHLKINKPGRPWAFLLSVVLHCLVLASLGLWTWQGSAQEPEVMTVYLAMPAAVPDIAPTITNITGGSVRPEPEVVRSEPQVLTELQKVKPKPAPEAAKPPTDPEPVPSPEVRLAKLNDADMEIVQEDENNVPSESIQETPEETGIKRLETAADNTQSGIRNPDSYLLAFANESIPVGMLGPDTLGPDLVDAAILSLPEPEYPVLSRKRGEEGRVVMEVTLSAQGEVRRAQVVDSSSYIRLDRAALKAVQAATFSPATKHGVPVESVTKVAYRFELR